MRVHEAQRVPILGSSIGCQDVSKLFRRMTRGSSVVLRVARMSSGRLSVSSREDTWKDGQGRCWVSLRWYKAPRIGAPLKISSSLTDVSWPLELPHTPWSQNKHMGASYITANKMINNLVDHRITSDKDGRRNRHIGPWGDHSVAVYSSHHRIQNIFSCPAPGPRCGLPSVPLLTQFHRYLQAASED